MIVGCIFSALVFGVGYGRVLLTTLILRTILVLIGTILTIVAAKKAVDVFVRGTAGDTEVGDLDLENMKDEEAESSESEDVESDIDLDVPEEPENTPDVEDESDVEELADMVSETMTDDAEET